MKQLVYASTATEMVKLEDVEDIVAKAKATNKKENVTGFLVFNSGYFLQVLEGERRPVNEVFCKIVSDRRHTDITLLS